MQLNERIPVRIALKEALSFCLCLSLPLFVSLCLSPCLSLCRRNTKRGRSKHTWLKPIMDQLKTGGTNISIQRPKETLEMPANTTVDQMKYKDVVRRLVQ